MTGAELRALTKLQIFTIACTRAASARVYEKLVGKGFAKHYQGKQPKRGGWVCFKLTRTGLTALRAEMARRG